jgi:RNA polymerase sigma factor (sigma-70 family)
MTTDTRITRPLAAEAHLGLVVLLAAQVARDETLLEDLVQAGCVGLLEALRRFDPTYGVCFSTYAVPWIRGQLRRVLQREQQRPPAPPLPPTRAADPLTPLLEQRELAAMQQGLPLLSLKERRVLELRFGLGDEPRHTLAETGLRLGISTGRARIIEQQALQRLRQTMDPDG